MKIYKNFVKFFPRLKSQVFFDGEDKFVNVEVGNTCICFDEYSHDYEKHTVKVNSIEYDEEYKTETNPDGMVCFVDDLTYHDSDHCIGLMYEGNFVSIIE